MSEFKCAIPATCANLGLGFDSIGIAVEKFMYIEASLHHHFHIEYNTSEACDLPIDTSNLIFKTAIHVAKQYDKKMPKIKVNVNSDIPLTRGLGSSSSAIVAGIELANYFTKLNLNDEEKLNIGCRIEGHPDNIGPCVKGGLFIGAYFNEELFYKTFSLEDIYCVLTIPDYPLSTHNLRAVLPKEYSKETTVIENALGNVLVTALVTKDYQLMGRLMMQDMLHEPFRSTLIKEFEVTKEVALKSQAYSTTISGAGPTILTLVDKDNKDAVYNQLTKEVDCYHEIVNVYNPSYFR